MALLVMFCKVTHWSGVAFRVQTAKKGMAGDILSELEQGNYGILVIGRKGSKKISSLGLVTSPTSCFTTRKGA
jgi:hypothetical protein